MPHFPSHLHSKKKQSVQVVHVRRDARSAQEIVTYVHLQVVSKRVSKKFRWCATWKLWETAPFLAVLGVGPEPPVIVSNMIYILSKFHHTSIVTASKQWSKVATWQSDNCMIHACTNHMTVLIRLMLLQ